MGEKISPLVALLNRKDAEIATLREKIAAMPDIVFCRECELWDSETCPMACLTQDGELINFAHNDGYCDQGERRESGENGK